LPTDIKTNEYGPKGDVNVYKTGVSFLLSVYNNQKFNQNHSHQLHLNVTHLLTDLNYAQSAGPLPTITRSLGKKDPILSG